MLHLYWYKQIIYIYMQEVSIYQDSLSFFSLSYSEVQIYIEYHTLLAVGVGVLSSCEEGELGWPENGSSASPSGLSCFHPI